MSGTTTTSPATHLVRRCFWHVQGAALAVAVVVLGVATIVVAGTAWPSRWTRSPAPRRWWWRLQGAALAALALSAALALIVAAGLVWSAHRHALAPRGQQQAVASIQGTKTTTVPAAVPPSASDLLEQGHPFMAIASSLESLRLTPYHDNAGWNIGYGYCISCRSSAAWDELRAAGLDENAVAALVFGPVEQKRAIRITPQQALALLANARSQAAQDAAAVLGTVYAAMPAERQAAMQWLAYNTGRSGLASFRHLRFLLKNHPGASAQIAAAMTPHIRCQTCRGGYRRNRRAALILAAAYAGHASLLARLRALQNLERPATASRSDVATAFAQERNPADSGSG